MICDGGDLLLGKSIIVTDQWRSNCGTVCGLGKERKSEWTRSVQMSSFSFNKCNEDSIHVVSPKMMMRQHCDCGVNR